MPIRSATESKRVSANKKMRPAGQVAFGALFCALALVFAYLESLLPPLVPVPGIKLGLANAAITLAMFFIGRRIAAAANLARICLAALLFGSLFSMIYSLCGAVLSMTVSMLLYSGKKLSPVTICAFAGAAHNLGQLLCAMVVMQNAGLVYYLPVLLLGGVIAGVVTGLVCLPLITRKASLYL